MLHGTRARTALDIWALGYMLHMLNQQGSQKPPTPKSQGSGFEETLHVYQIEHV